MNLRIESLTARSLAGLIYSNKIPAQKVYQILEEDEQEEKLEEVQELLSEMMDVDAHFENNNR